MEKRQIINIINFVRYFDPRTTDDLTEPVREQIRLMKQHNLRGTFLLQYDTLLSDRYIEIFKALDPNQFEMGVWFEVVQPQTESCGIPWTGRWAWDWHTHCGFSVGYTREQREQLVDILYERFKTVFGYYPRVFGSWLFDTHTVRYIADRYGADAYCNCKEQYGTDGYTLWGSFYGQAYYPSRNNVFMPAQSEESRLDVPLFRMLGSDPVYQFDFELDPSQEKPIIQRVITLEPVYTESGGGGDDHWVDWFMKENFNGDCLSFGYAQAGQENSFGWAGMSHGLTYQFALFEQLQKEGKIEVEPFGETGRWFKETYRDTPPSAITAHTAFDSDKNTVWYSTKYFRTNLYSDGEAVRIRDLHIFTEQLTDPYEEAVCTENHATYETLPFIDGNRYTGKGVLAGGWLRYADGSAIGVEDMTFTDNGDGSATVCFGDITAELQEDALILTAPKPFVLENRIGIDGGHLPEVRGLTDRELALSYCGVDYAVLAVKGTFLDSHTLSSEENVLELRFRA